MSLNDKDDDYMLITKAKNGDTRAYENLVLKYQGSIYALCCRMTGAHQSADDLSQETFIKAFFSLSRFKENMSFFSWIRKIAVNSALNYLKKRNRERPIEEFEHRQTANPGPEFHESPPDRIERSQMEKRFRSALQSLPIDQRVVFTLKVFEGLSYQEIAQTLKISNGTVMSRLSRARRRLRILMADYLQGEGR